MCLGNNTVNETFLFNRNLMENSDERKILGDTIDKKIKFFISHNELHNKGF